MPSLPTKRKIFSILGKDPLKREIDLLPQCTIPHEKWGLPQIFQPWLQYQIKLESGYTSKKIKNATGVDISNLSVTRFFTTLKDEVDK